MNRNDIVGNYSRWAASIALIALMVGTAELTGEKEIIFPEIMGLAVGYIAAPSRGWKADTAHMTIAIAICACAGVFIVRYMPGPVWLQLAAAYLTGQLVLAFSGTTFGPMLSAAALPVLMGTESIIYPVSAIVMTFISGLTGSMLEKAGLMEKNDFRHIKADPDWKAIAVKVACACLVAFGAITLDIRFAVAPPLLVAFNESAKPEAPPRKRPVTAVLLTGGCALAGSVLRLVICSTLGLPLTLAAVLSAGAALVMMDITKMYLPPAGAMGILAMLIPASALVFFPLQVLAGISVLMILALVVFRKK